MKKKSFDFYFFVVVISLLAFGLIMVFSASTESARADANLGNNPYHYIRNQMMWAVLGLVAMFVAANFNYKRLQKLSVPMLIVTGILLILVLFIGRTLNGSKRWIYIGSMSLQPSELAKISVILFFANSLALNYKKLNKFWEGLFPYLAILGVIAVLLMLEPHFSATVVIALISCIMLFVAGAKISHFLGLALAAIPAAVFMIIKEPYRLQRVTSFFNPFADKLGDGWQVIQSLYAIGSGGIFGLGLGRSRQKFLYIPEPHNDFIFSILCEELGLLGAIVVIALFAMLIYRGIKIAINAPDMFSSLVAIGIVSMIAVEVIINIAVVTSTMPVTGMPLPFFSYGGTTLLMNLTAMGIMLNISRYSKN